MAEGPVHGGISPSVERRGTQHVRYASLSQDEDEDEEMTVSAVDDSPSPSFDTPTIANARYARYLYVTAAVTSLGLFIGFVVDVTGSHGPLRIVSPKESGKFLSALVSMIFYGLGIVLAALQVWQVRKMDPRFLKPVWLASMGISALYIFLVITSMLTIVVFDLMGKKKTKGKVIGGHMVTVGFMNFAAAGLSYSSYLYRLILLPSHPNTVSIAPMETFSSN